MDRDTQKVKVRKITPGIVLYCGDCLEIMRELKGGSISLVFTDPPYGHNNNNGDLIHNREAALGYVRKGKPRPIRNDGPEADCLFRAALAEWTRLLVEGGGVCCCCGGGPDPGFARWSLWMDKALNFKQMVVWDKGPMGMGWHYRRSYETILVSYKGKKCNWYDDSHRIENIIRPGNYGIRKIIPRKDQHPTEKPVELALHFIRLHTRQGDTVLDPFMGSGSTGIAAIRTGRKFIGIEIDPEWFDVSVRRMESEAKETKRRLFPMCPPARLDGSDGKRYKKENFCFKEDKYE